MNWITSFLILFTCIFAIVGSIPINTTTTYNDNINDGLLLKNGTHHHKGDVSTGSVIIIIAILIFPIIFFAILSGACKCAKCHIKCCGRVSGYAI
jgi:hypothetical protein